MQIGSTHIPPATMDAGNAAPAGRANAAAQSSGPDRIDQAIAGYYRDLNAKLPLYQDLHGPSVVGTTIGRDIREQLEALAGKAIEILARNNWPNVELNSARLNGFLAPLQKYGTESGLMTAEEISYFYSQPFKVKLERDIAAADLATGDDIRPAMEQLDALCNVLSSPMHLYREVVLKTIVKSYVDRFTAAIDMSDRHRPAAPAGNRPATGLPLDARRI